ncbi:Ig-like domain-containing protein [Longimicrobium sp.]|uniref:Ig-like domain-containing protein n=1 Tax=Longimicrobium sp. TaxID=2029185 RepID=UPI002E31BC4B|nr:Ig-like domain-containing protein [Longimicrobium sp.]HEX6036724.1 Ig-like domain-containing protein [Longimicrobium sp.]
MRSSTFLALAVLAACGGGGAAPVTGGGPGTDGGTLASFAISHPEGAVTVGDTMIMEVVAKDATGQPLAGATPSFTSSDATVATVDGAGVVRGLKAGASTITGSLTMGGVTKTATYGIAVLAASAPPTNPPAQTVAAFALNPASVTLSIGAAQPFEPIATDASGARITGLPAVAWSVQDPSRASVASGTVTGVAAGSTTVTASFTSGGRTWTATANVTVAAPAPPPVPSTATVQGVDDAFTPSAVTIAAGGTVTWTMVDEEHDVTWTGAAPTGGSIGRIDRGRSVSRTFPAAGTYTYTCNRHDGDHGGTVTVTQGGTQQPVLTSVRITPASPAVSVGSTVQLTATPLDQAGQPMTGVPAANWTTSDAARATVGATGTVTGVAAGTAAITARITHGGVTREAAVTLTVGGTTPPPPPPGAPLAATVTTPGTSFSPATVTIAAGGTVTWQFTGSSRHNVTFSGTAPTGGNIPDTDVGGSAARTFTTAGTYSYACTRHSGMNGTVVVQP